MQTKIVPFISQEALQKRVQELGECIAQKHPTDGILLISTNEFEGQFVQDLQQSIGERAKIAKLSDDWEAQEKLCILLVKYLIESGELLDQMRLQMHDQFQIQNLQEAAIFSVCLLQRITSKKIVREPDYLGFSIPDECVVGYGMGIQGKYDSLPHIAAYDAS